MNAFDKIKPKSPRLVILAALAKSGMLTLDELQTQTGEERKKIQDNAMHAINLSLIERVRDDVTHLPAYQITALGRRYWLKHTKDAIPEPEDPQQTGQIVNQAWEIGKKKVAEKEAAKSSEPESTETTPPVLFNQSKNEIIAVGQQAIDALAAKDAEIAKLRQECDATATSLRTISDALEAKAQALSLWINMAALFGCEKPEQIADSISGLDCRIQSFNKISAPVGYVIQRPAKVLVRVSKRDRAEERALCFARREGKRAKVFALIPVGESVPGAEWKDAE